MYKTPHTHARVSAKRTGSSGEETTSENLEREERERREQERRERERVRERESAREEGEGESMRARRSVTARVTAVKFEGRAGFK